MKVYQVRGYPASHFFVSHKDFHEMMVWFRDNDVKWLQESSSLHGVGFSIRGGNSEWFALRWL